MRPLYTFGAWPIAVLLCLMVPAAATIYWTPAHELAPLGLGGGMSASDFDQDGDIDISVLVVDPAEHYWNVGSATAPVWEQDSSLLASVPWCVHRDGDLGDLDGDGDQDLAVACFYDDFVRFCWNIGSAGPVEWLPDNGVLAGIPKYGGDSHPRFADMDADGDLDFLMVASSGVVQYAENVGTPSSPAWEYMGLIDGIGWSGSDPRIGLGDLDGDGDIDIVRVTWSSGPECFENIGTPQAFEFVGNPDLLEGPEWPAYSLGIELFDVDGDGDPDMLLDGNDPSPPYLLYLNQGDDYTPVEQTTWGMIKAMYRVPE